MLGLGLLGQRDVRLRVYHGGEEQVGDGRAVVDVVARHQCVGAGMNRTQVAFYTGFSAIERCDLHVQTCFQICWIGQHRFEVAENDFESIESVLVALLNLVDGHAFVQPGGGARDHVGLQ